MIQGELLTEKFAPFLQNKPICIIALITFLYRFLNKLFFRRPMDSDSTERCSGSSGIRTSQIDRARLLDPEQRLRLLQQDQEQRGDRLHQHLEPESPRSSSSSMLEPADRAAAGSKSCSSNSVLRQEFMISTQSIY